MAKPRIEPRFAPGDFVCTRSGWFGYIGGYTHRLYSVNTLQGRWLDGIPQEWVTRALMTFTGPVLLSSVT